MLETKKLDIQNTNVHITQFNCREALKLSVQTMQYFSETYFEILKKIYTQSGKIDADMKPEDFENELTCELIEALKSLTKNIQIAEFEDYCYKMLAKTIVVNEYVTAENFAEIFGANWSLLYKVLFEVIKFNFGGFFFDLVFIIKDEMK